MVAESINQLCLTAGKSEAVNRADADLHAEELQKRNEQQVERIQYGRERPGERANERRGKKGDVEAERARMHRAREPGRELAHKTARRRTERVGVGALKVVGIAGHVVKAQHARLRLYMKVEAVRRRTAADRHVDYAETQQRHA